MEIGKNVKRTRESLYGSAVEWLENLISSGDYSPGDKLPSERELCERLNVSRTVMREALRSVEARGLIKVYAGKGVFVSEPDFRSLITPMEMFINKSTISVSDLVAARHILEPSIAHTAALNVTNEDILKLQDNLQSMKENLRNGDAFINADQQFHMNIALATKNKILYVMARTIVESLTILRTTVYEIPGAPEQAVHRHQEIIDALKAHDANRSFAVMEQHILDSDGRQRLDLMKNSLQILNHG